MSEPIDKNYHKLLEEKVSELEDLILDLRDDFKKLKAVLPDGKVKEVKMKKSIVQTWVLMGYNHLTKDANGDWTLFHISYELKAGQVPNIRRGLGLGAISSQNCIPMKMNDLPNWTIIKL